MRLRLISQLLYPLAGVVLIIVVWILACWFFNIPTVVLPSPDKVLRSLIIRSDLLMSEGWITLKETLYGFVLALVVGLPLAVAIANSRPLNLMFYPLLIALQSVPKVALAPMILVWLGTGLDAKLAIVWLVAFFPIIVDTAAGLRATPKELLELAHSLNASPLQIFLKVQLPAALPFIVTGAKVAITLAVIGAVIGEFIGSSEGLGFLLLSATSQLDTPLAFAALFALSVLGIFAYALVGAGERMMAPWCRRRRRDTEGRVLRWLETHDDGSSRRRPDLRHPAPTPCARMTPSEGAHQARLPGRQGLRGHQGENPQTLFPARPVSQRGRAMRVCWKSGARRCIRRCSGCSTRGWSRSCRARA